MRNMAAPIKHARGEVNSVVAILPLPGLSNVVAYACRHACARIGMIVTQVAIARRRPRAMQPAAAACAPRCLQCCHGRNSAPIRRERIILRGARDGLVP